MTGGGGTENVPKVKKLSRSEGSEGQALGRAGGLKWE